MEFLHGTDPQTCRVEFLVRIDKSELRLIPPEILKTMSHIFESSNSISEKLIAILEVIKIIEEDEKYVPDLVLEINKILSKSGIFSVIVDRQT